MLLGIMFLKSFCYQCFFTKMFTEFTFFVLKVDLKNKNLISRDIVYYKPYYSLLSWCFDRHVVRLFPKEPLF